MNEIFPFLITLVLNQSAKISALDWNVPPNYRAVTIRKRVRFFQPKLIALTFDDGPSLNNTPRILQTLKLHHDHATFFILGEQAKLYPQLVKAINDDGNAIGIHTYTHARHPSIEQSEKEMNRTEAILKLITGRSTQLFRPPYGNTHSAYTRTAQKRGYSVILWTVSSADTATHDPKMVLDNVTLGVEPGDIVLMHDSENKSHTADALPKVLDRLEKQGFQLVTIPELFEAWNQKYTTKPKSGGVFGKPSAVLSSAARLK